MINRYAGKCSICGARVPANGGTLTRTGKYWQVKHLACGQSNQPEVIVTRFNSGAEVYQNRKGRCEDAPCCGCCS